MDKTTFDFLPSEIVALILETGYLAVRNESSAFRTTASQVNRRWRECVLHTPAMWSILDISMEQPIGLALHSLSLALERSRDYPLDISLDFSSVHDYSVNEEASRIMDKIAPHGPRWERVDIAMVASQAAHTYLNQIPVPNLKHLIISASRPIDQISFFHEGVIPALSSLVLDRVDLSTIRLTFRNLTTLKISRVMLGPSSFDALNGSLTLKQFEVHLDFDTLRHFGTASISDEVCIAPFLKRFSFPHILSLTVTNREHASLYYQYTAPSPEKAPQDSARIDHVELCVRQLQPFLLPHCPTITTLELHDVHWPPNPVLENMFDAMTALESLSITGLDNTPSILFPGAPEGRSFSLPSLRRLHIAMKVGDQGNIRDASQNRLRPLLTPADEWLSHIREALGISAFSCFVPMLMPATLQYLSLDNLSSTQWESFVKALIDYKDDCAQLHTLEIANSQDVIASHIPFTVAFPHITHLTLHKVTTNSFIRHLVVNEVKSTTSVSCPSLHHLAISCDDLASRRLLHQVIDTRRSAGYPITQLKLDRHFGCNADSWDWINQNVQNVVETGICSKHAPWYTSSN